MNAEAAHLAKPRALPAAPTVLLVGNPNAGKSTLFNKLTGGQAQVGNFAGTTVEAARASWVVGDRTVELVDLPGTYSLAAARPDERVALDALLGLSEVGLPDALVVVADAPRLMRSLYLVLQLLELQLPVVVVVNLMDEALAQGLVVDLLALEDALGVPVVGTVARQGKGLDEVRAALSQVLELESPRRGTVGPNWSDVLQQHVSTVADDLPAPYGEVAGAPRGARALAVARWMLLSADADGRVPGAADPIPAVVAARQAAEAAGQDLQGELVAARYAWIDARQAQFLGQSVVAEEGWTDRLDRVVLHPLWGTGLFLLVMAAGFSALFSWADPLIAMVEAGMAGVGSAASAALVALGSGGALTILHDLVVDGVIGGVGAVVVFLPQIALLFLFLAVLEDSGYLARAAHLADRVLRAAGLPGAAFVPLLSGYACAVPAILATRTMPRFRDRLLTMLVLPLTSCSARLPIYTLLIAALFPATLWGPVPLRPVALAGMYLFSTLVALGAAILLGRTVLQADAGSALIELPPYRWPDPRVVVQLVWRRCVEFLKEAGGIILVATVVLWGLLYFPRPDVPVDTSDPVAASQALEQSYAGRIGKAIEPAIEPPRVRLEDWRWADWCVCSARGLRVDDGGGLRRGW